jgi:hypothetical protein
MERFLKLVLEHEKEEKSGVYGARTRNLRRDRAAL